jgi:hypothetical protein
MKIEFKYKQNINKLINFTEITCDDIPFPKNYIFKHGFDEKEPINKQNFLKSKKSFGVFVYSLDDENIFELIKDNIEWLKKIHKYVLDEINKFGDDLSFLELILKRQKEIIRENKIIEFIKNLN